MIEILDKIRKPCIFILLLLLNFWFFSSYVLKDKSEVLYGLMILFFFFSFDYNKIRRESLYWLLVFIVISALDFSSHKMNVLTPLVLMQCTSQISLKTYLRYNLIILGTTAVLLLLTIGEGRMMLGEGIDLVRIRHDMGYGHPNVAAMYYWGIFICSILYCYLSRYRNFLWILTIVLALGCIYVYEITVSRSFIVALFLFLFVLGYYSLRKKLAMDYRIGYSRYILWILPMVMTVLTIYFPLNADKYSILDVLVSGRLTLYKELLISLTPIQYILGTGAFDKIVIDSSYLHLMFEAGILLFVYFLWLYFFAVREIVKQQNFVVIAILVSFLGYGLTESLFLLPMILGNNLLWVLLYRYRWQIDEESETEVL